MKFTRRSVRLAAIISMILLTAIAVSYSKYEALEDWGPLLYAVSIASCVFVFAGIAFRWETPGWLKRITVLIFFLAAPLVMVIAVERLNGNFLTDFLSGDEDVLANYVVSALLYLLVFGLSGSVRVSVMSVSPVLLLFGIANMYIKEFKGSPLVPMDFGSIQTAANVAAGYTYEIGYEILFGVSLTAAGMDMPKWKLPAKIITRFLALLVVGGFAYTFFYTDYIADNGLKPDFFNQTRGYNHHGAVLELRKPLRAFWRRRWSVRGWTPTPPIRPSPYRPPGSRGSRRT